jgi:hypothetical protein
MTPERCTSQLRSITMAPPLSPRKRGKIVAHVLDGKTYQEIAQKYNVVKGTVAYTMRRERLHNTRKSLPTGRRPHKMLISQGDQSDDWPERLGCFPNPPGTILRKPWTSQRALSGEHLPRCACTKGSAERRKKPFLSLCELTGSQTSLGSSKCRPRLAESDRSSQTNVSSRKAKTSLGTIPFVGQERDIRLNTSSQPSDLDEPHRWCGERRAVAYTKWERSDL